MSELNGGQAICKVCPHHCRIAEGKTGRCRARGVRDGRVIPLNYGIVTSLALDPIEKKPLARFRPGSRILSYGSYGCNLSCPFCQNWEISMSDGSEYQSNGKNRENQITPESLADMAEQLTGRGNIGVAFTYNEPLISYEYVVDTARLLREKKQSVVLVTNGCVTEETADTVLPYIDALNIDLKSFRDDVYRKTLGGDLEAVKRFIRKANELCHVELTSLIVPGMNDSEDEIREMTQWIASLPNGEEIPLHITRFFPRYRVLDRRPTERAVILHLVDVAGEQLEHVYPGNL